MAIQNINELYDQLSSNENFSSFNFGSSDEFKSYLQELPEDKKQKFYNVWLQDQDVSKEQFDSLLKKKEPARTGILSSALGSIDLGSPSVSEPQAIVPAPEVTPVVQTPEVAPIVPAPEISAQTVGTQTPEVPEEQMGMEDYSVSGAEGGPVDVGPGKPKPKVFKPDFRTKSQIAAELGTQKEAERIPVKQTPEVIKKVREKAIQRKQTVEKEKTENLFKDAGFEFKVATGREIMDQRGTRKEYKTVAKQPSDAEIGEVLLKNTQIPLANGVDVGRVFGRPTYVFDNETYTGYLERKGFNREEINELRNYYIDQYIKQNSETDAETKLAKIEGKDINEKLTKFRQQEDEKGLTLLAGQYGIDVAEKARELQSFMAKRKRPGEAGYDQWNKQLQTLQKEMSNLVGGGERLYNPEDGKLYDAETAPKRAVAFKVALDKAIKLYGNTDIDKLKQIRSALYDQVNFLEGEYDRMLGSEWRGKAFLKGLSGTITEQQKEGLIQTFAKLDELKAKLSAVNSRILTNTDIEPRTTDKTGQFLKQLRAGLPGGNFASKYQTLKDDYNAYIQGIEGEIELKKGEAEKGELTFGEQLVGGLGSTIPIMAEIAITRRITPSAAFLRSSGYLRPVTRGVLKTTGSTKFANFMTDAVANAVQGYATYAPTSETGVTGVGETLFSQTIWDKVGLEKMGAKWAPVLRYLSKTALGTTGETIEEFVGEFSNNLSETGFDWSKSAEETFGKDISEFGKKLALYASTSALLSGVYNSPELAIKSLRINEVIAESENKLQDPNLSQTDREAIKSSLEMMKKTKEQLTAKKTEEEIPEPVSTIGEITAEEMPAPEGVTPPVEGAEAAAFEVGEGPLETPQAVGAQPVSAQEVNKELAKEGITDVSLQRVEDYGKQIESGNADFERFSPSEQRGLIEGGPVHVAATIITGKSDRAADTQDDSNDRQEEIIKEYAQKKGIWMENAPAKLKEKYGDPFESGKESLVWIDEARGVVVKSSVTDQYPTLREALDGITLSNAYFPAAKITVVGFGTNEKGEFEIITEQPYIQGVNPTEQEIKEHFNKLGFTENERLYQGKDAFGNEEVIFKDAAPKNVIKTPEGNIVPIDLIAKINKPELNANGTRTVPSTVTEEVTEEETIESKTLRAVESLFEKYKNSPLIKQYIEESKRTNNPIDDRAYARIVDTYFDELPIEVKRYLEYDAPATDFETPEGYSPYYKGFGYNRSEETGHTPGIHGSHITTLRENVFQQRSEAAPEAVGAQPEVTEQAPEVTEGSLSKEIKKSIPTAKELTAKEKKVLNDLSSTENITLEEYKKVFSRYKINDFKVINDLLRKGLPVNKENLVKQGVAPITAEVIEEDYNNVVRILSNTTFSPKEKITLYRSTDYIKAEGAKLQDLSKYKVGDKISDAAFVSTTIDENKFKDVKTSLIKFELNPGDQINGTYLAGNEKEFLIDKNTEFVVKNKEIVNGNTVLTVGLPSTAPKDVFEYGAQNKIITKQKYDEAVKNLRNPNLPSGFDFSKIGELVKAAMYHIEAGSRKFADFTKKMVEQFGRGVKQYLPNVFRRANNQMQQQQAAAPTPTAAPAPVVKTSAQVKQDVTNNYNYIVSTNPNMTEDQIGQELVNRGFSLGEIKRFVPQLRNFWEKQAIDTFEKFVDDFKGKFQSRRNEIEDFMQRNPGLDYAQVYDQLKGKYSDFELFKMFYEDGLDGDVLDNLFGTEYRQTIQRAIESKNYNPDFLRDLDKDIKSRKTLNNLGESRSLFAELQDFATAEQLLSAAADVLGLSGIEEAMKTMTDELRAENEQKKLILETYGQIIQGNVTEDNVKLMSEMLSFSGRMLRMGRGLFMTEKGLADLIIKNLETIEIKQSTIFSKKKRAFRVSEGNKKKIQDGVKKYFETKGELDVATKALQEGVDSFTEDTFGNFDKAKENHQRATQDLKGLINRLYGSRQPMFSRFFTSMTSLGLLRFATAAVGLVGNLENMFASMPRRGVGKLLGWTRVLADKIAGAGVYYRLKTGKTPLAAEALKRGTGVGIDPALYRSLAYQEGIRQIKDILFKGLSETSTSQKNFLEGYAEIDGVKDFQLAFNMMKKLTMNFLNKEKFTEEEFATAFDKMLLALEEKDANGNPKLALMHSKGYYTASTLMRGLFGAIPSITGRAIALSGDRYFYKLGFYEFLAAYANSKGITDPKEVGQFIRLHSIGDSDLTKAAEEAGNRRIFAQNNKLVKFNAAAIGSLEKKESSIFGTKIKKKIEGKGFQAKAQNIIAAPVVGTRILLNSFAPFVRIPSNAIHKYLRIAFPPYTLVRASIAQAMLSSEMNRYQENYGLDRNAEISETKKKKMEADRIKLFEQQRMTAQYWTEFFQGSQLYVLAYLLVEAGAVGAPYGDDEESKKRARAAGIAQQDAGKINLSQLFRSLSGEDRGRTMQTGDVTFDYRNLGMLGFVISSMASIKGAYRTSKLEQKKMLGTEENMVNTIGAKMLVESLQNGITQLSFIQNISSLLGALKEGGFEKAGKDFATNLITTTATVPTLSYGVFSPFDKTQGISADPFRNFNPDLEERDYFMGEVGARVWTKLTARSPLYGFGMRDENGEFVAPLKVLGLTPSKFYRPQIGPFGERLYKKSTFWDTRSGSKTDKFLAFIQASIDPFSFSDYEGFVSNVKPYNEKQKYKRGDYVEWNNNVWVVLRDGLQGISPKTANIAEYASENADYFLIDKKYDFMDPDQFRRDKQGSQKTKLLFDFVNLYEEAVGDRKPYAVFSKLYKDPVKFKDEDGEFAIYIPIDEQRKLSIMRGEAMSRVFDDQTVESYISAIDKAADNENMTDSEYKEYVKDIFKTYFLGPIDNENNRGGGLVDKVNEAISKVENKPEYIRIVRDGIVKSIEEGNLTKEEFDRLKKISEAAGFVNELNEKKLKFRN